MEFTITPVLLVPPRAAAAFPITPNNLLAPKLVQKCSPTLIRPQLYSSDVSKPGSLIRYKLGKYPINPIISLTPNSGTFARS